jgi:hypothetical protein
MRLGRATLSWSLCLSLTDRLISVARYTVYRGKVRFVVVVTRFDVVYVGCTRQMADVANAIIASKNAPAKCAPVTWQSLPAS